VSLGHRRPVAGLDPDASSWAKASAVTLGVIVSCAQFGSIVSERSAITRSPASACWNAQGQLTQEVVSSRSDKRWSRPAAPSAFIANDSVFHQRSIRGPECLVGSVRGSCRSSWTRLVADPSPSGSAPPAGTARVESESDAFGAMAVTLPEVDPVPHEATPGELLAVAHAMFMAAALAEGLALAGTPANEIVVEADCTCAGPVPDRELIELRLHVSGRVPGLAAAGFCVAVENARRRSLRTAGGTPGSRGSTEADVRRATVQCFGGIGVTSGSHVRRRRNRGV